MAKKKPEVKDDATLPTTALEELYQKMVELSPDSIFTMDSTGKTLSCNEATTKMTGFYKDELIGANLADAPTLPPEDVPKYLALLKSALDGQGVEKVEATLLRKDKTPVIILSPLISDKKQA